MKCLSIKQPFAELVISGRKKIEIRNWKTNYRGELLIHASKSPDATAFKRFGMQDMNLALGVIVGKVNLVDCKDYRTGKAFITDKNLHLAEDRSGNHIFGFQLERPVRFNCAIPLKGRLGLFEVNL